jgi:hypothetical protein
MTGELKVGVCPDFLGTKGETSLTVEDSAGRLFINEAISPVSEKSPV